MGGSASAKTLVEFYRVAIARSYGPSSCYSPHNCPELEIFPVRADCG